MSSPERLALLAAALLVTGAAPPAKGPNLGTPLAPADERVLDFTVMPDGSGLPAGRGDVATGARLYAAQCEACHGPAGARPIGQIPALTGGVGSLASARPVRTVASYWPYAPLLFDYVRRAMPPTAPGSLGPDQVYAVTAYILSVDGIVPAGATLDQSSLAGVRMPNRDGFVIAGRPAR